MGMILEEEILDKAGKDMAREIDREVLWGLFEGLGWTRFKISRLTDNNHARVSLNETVQNFFLKILKMLCSL
jgi:hypothetical protein